MIYFIVLVGLLLALWLLTKSAKSEYDKEVEFEARQAPILEAKETLSTLDRDHAVVDVKEKVAERASTLESRERKLAESEVSSVEEVPEDTTSV